MNTPPFAFCSRKLETWEDGKVISASSVIAGRRSYVMRMSPQFVTARSSLPFVLMDRPFRELCAPIANERPINANIVSRSRASLDLMVVTDTDYSRMVGLIPERYP